MGVDIGPGYDGILGRGRGSKLKVKCLKSCLNITNYYYLPFFEVKVKGEVKVIGQGHRSGVKGQCQICGMQQSILGARFAEMVDYSQVWAKEDCYQSEEFVCVSVIRGLVWIISQTWSISF